MTVADLAFTGERFLPDCQGEIWLEHWHRYHFAASLARDRRVLDVASGEGYGSALLALTAREVVGVDAAADAVVHAKSEYKDRPNLRFVTADCAHLPFPDAAFDLVVSFETIEHITAQREFLAEVRRVLAPSGLLLLSSPNKAEYTDRRGYANPFHVAELYRDELRALIDAFFPHTVWYGQSIGFCSTIAAESATFAANGKLVDAGSSATSLPAPAHDSAKEPLYYLVGCALSLSPLTALDMSFSVLGDPEDTVYRDYQDTYRKFVAASEAVTVFRERETRHEHDLAVAGQATQASLDTALSRLGAVENQRDAALAEGAESQAENDALQGARETAKAEIGRLQVQVDDLKGLTATLGATLHAAQQAALRLTDALHEANFRYQAALDAAHGANERLVQAAAATRDRHQQELARRDAAVAELRQALELRDMELDRRAGWRWRLRPPWRRG
jgi:SAM-dependent methyltransferase